MKQLLKIMTILLFLFAVSAFLSQPRAYAADHRDSGAVDGVPEGDITDIFAFVSPEHPDRLVLVMNVNPFANPNELPSYGFGTDLLYQFKIDNAGDVGTHEVVQIVFSGVGQAQTYQVLFGNATSGQQGAARNTILPSSNVICAGTVYQLLANNQDATSTAAAINNGTLAGSRCFAGLRDDPFVTDVSQAVFRIGLNPNAAAPSAVTHDQDVFRAEVSNVFGPLRGHALRADGTSGVDGFGGFDLTSIAIELPISSVRSPLSSLIGVWGTVSSSNGDGTFTQFERMGQQLTNTVWVFKQPPFGAVCAACSSAASDNALKDLFNASDPSVDIATFGGLGPDSLTVLPNDGGVTPNTLASRALVLTAAAFTTLPFGTPLILNQVPGGTLNADVNFIRKILFPDVLRIDTNITASSIQPGAAAASNGDPFLGVARGINNALGATQGFCQNALGCFDYRQYGLTNGRRPADDVTDIELRLGRELTDVKFSPNTIPVLPSLDPNLSTLIPGSGAQGNRHTLQCTQLNVTTVPITLCEDHRIFAVLQGTDFIKVVPTDIANVTDSGNDRPLPAAFPWEAGPHPLPSDAGTVGFPDQTDGAQQQP